MGGNAPLVQGAAPAATRNVNIAGGYERLSVGIGKYPRFHFCGISGHLGVAIRRRMSHGCRDCGGLKAPRKDWETSAFILPLS